MSQRGLVIDSVEFARQHEELRGRLAPASLPRLAEMLFDAMGSLEYLVAGGTAQTTEGSAEGSESSLVVSIDGNLHLICQRCLAALDWPVRIRNRLTLIRPGAAWPDETLEDDSSDPIEATRCLDVTALLEDEILLALPIAPVHAACKPLGTMASTAKGKTSPFAQLPGLMRE